MAKSIIEIQVGAMKRICNIKKGEHGIQRDGETKHIWGGVLGEEDSICFVLFLKLIF